LTRFLTEAAQIEDTSLQISDMKIPQLKMLRSLGDILRSGVHPRTHKAAKKSNPVDTADK